jgi:hypothetical protein
MLIHNDDILFDDLTVIRSLQGAGHPASSPMMYNDCTNNYNDCTNNVYVHQRLEQPSPDYNLFGINSIIDENIDTAKSA